MQRDGRAYEAVVIGGGPAGSAATFTMASRGIDTCVIDRKAFPRDKLCGGLVTLRSKRVFEDVFATTWDDTLFTQSDSVKFYSRDKFLAEIVGHTTLYFTMRFSFDEYLLRLAEGTGADLILDAEITSLYPEQGYLDLASGERITFRFLVGADGVNSLVAKQLFGKSFDAQTIGFGLEAEVPKDRLPGAFDDVEIDFGAARWGYGWVFPKKSSYTVGVGGIHSSNKNLRVLMDKYLDQKNIKGDDIKIKGQYIPFGDYRSVPGKGTTLLCGDAAGLVDPITGEGIAYAMESGAAAGQAIIGHRSRASSVLSTYIKSYENMSRNIMLARRWRSLIFSPIARLPFKLLFADAGTMQRGYLDILSGTNDYDDLPRILGKQMSKATLKLVRNLTGQHGRTS